MEHGSIHQRILQSVSLLAGAALLGLFASACIMTDSKCDAHQVQSSADLHMCSCEPGYVLSPMGYGCIACGENEEVMNEKCVCKPGFERANAMAPCEAVEGSVPGESCDAADSCNDPNPYCALSEDEPYCTTQDCTKNDDCTVNWQCDTSAEPSFCKPISGLSAKCDSAADCSGEATYCELFNTRTCIINDCVADPGICPSQWVCCDFTALAGTSMCVSIDFLMDGKCLGGSDPVMP